MNFINAFSNKENIGGLLLMELIEHMELMEHLELISQNSHRK
jgi:hypothetical protein